MSRRGGAECPPAECLARQLAVGLVEVAFHGAKHPRPHQWQLVEGRENKFQVRQKRRQLLGVGVVAQGGVEHGVETALLSVQHDGRRLVIGHVGNGLPVGVLRPL